MTTKKSKLSSEMFPCYSDDAINTETKLEHVSAVRSLSDGRLGLQSVALSVENATQMYRVERTLRGNRNVENTAQSTKNLSLTFMVTKKSPS
jgi:hypothetical protein